MSDSDLESAIAGFLGAYEVVFDSDWEYSRDLMEHHMAYAIGASGTFARPEPGFENKNWGARTALIRAHQELTSLLRDRNVAPDLPVQDAYFNFGWSTGPKATTAEPRSFSSAPQRSLLALLRRLKR